MLRGSIYIDLFDLPTRTIVEKYKVTKHEDKSIKEEYLGIVANNFYSPENIESPIYEFPGMNDREKSRLQMDKATSYIISHNESSGDRCVYMRSMENIRVKMYKSAPIWFVPHDIPIFSVFHHSIGGLKGLPDLKNFACIMNLDKPSTNRIVSFTTDKLTQLELDANIRYVYKIKITIELFKNDLLLKSINIKATTWQDLAFGGVNLTCDLSTDSTPINPQDIYIKASFECGDLTRKSQEQPYLVKPYKYSLYNLLRKAMLTIDTQIIDTTKHGLDPLYDENNNDIGIQYPIVISSGWEDKLKQTIVNDSIFEGRNFLEILLQIGKYLHATPKLRFASDGTDRYELYFIQLGDTKERNNDSRKITVYNSKALSEYYTQFDSYVQNLFSSQNSVEEFLVPKTSDASYLISNDTAELYTKYNILEIIEFDISIDGENYVSAIDYIFEKSVYDTLPSDPNITPSKGSSLYYTLGSNKILGLDYAPPKVVGVNLTSLKTICNKLFKINAIEKLNYNLLTFRIKYRTQDSLRLTQFKPNLSDFIKDNQYESYPHNEQFYNQQDKIIDSEKFSSNLWGQLIKSANEKYTCNEYCTPMTEKEVGQLVFIEDAVYYVTAIDAEYYNEAILQKVQYSKNFNNFSAVTSIPCEPRFYEISERSSIRRETRQFDFFELTDSIEDYKPNTAKFVTNWQEYIKRLIFCEDNQNAEIPNYVYLKFMTDKFRQHINSEGYRIDDKPLFPSCEQENNKDGIYQTLPNSNSRGVIVPVLHYPLKNSILFEWDMEDNFKAGDAVKIAIGEQKDNKKEAYYTMQSARYCDVFGGADLMQFTMFSKKNFSREEQQRLPFAEESNGNGQADFIPQDSDRIFGIGGKYAIGLDKDNREAISGNLQLVLLNKSKENRNGFVFINTVFNKKNARLKLGLLNISVPLISQALEMTSSTMVVEDITYNLDNEDTGYIVIQIPKKQEKLNDIDFSKVKSLVWYDEEKNGTKIPYIVKNLATVPDEEKIDPLYIISIYGKGE